MDILQNLNENQRAAVRHTEGPLMVLAGPGSGKTTVITYRALYMSRLMDPAKLLVITYSKAAATQMESRYKALAKPYDFLQTPSFGTFHAMFFRVLRRQYDYSTEQVLQEGERRKIINDILTEKAYAGDDDILNAILNEISEVKNELCPIENFDSAAIDKNLFREIFKNYEDFKYSAGRIDFDDMLEQCYKLWRDNPASLEFWQRKYPYIMVDEFQDINHVQYEAVRLLAAKHQNLCIVGDDDQSIYRFRGARPDFLLQFPKDYPGTNRVILDTNYRSTNPIIALSNRIISGNVERYDKEITGTERPGKKPGVLTFKDPDHEARAIADMLKSKMSAANLEEVAVIYRTNIQARAFADAFLQANIPYIVKDELSTIYEHWIAKDFFAYLRLACGTGQKREQEDDLKQIINRPFRYISKIFLEAAKQSNILQLYGQTDMLNEAQKRRVEELLQDLRAMKKMKPAQAIDFLRKRILYDDYLCEHADYKKISPAGLLETASELQEAAKSFANHEDFLAHTTEAIARSKEPRQDDDIGRVTLSTIHSAKGLEFETVFLTGAVEGLIPHERSKTAAELEEERRLFYVGITRAKERLYITVPKTRHEKVVKPSRFISKR